MKREELKMKIARQLTVTLTGEEYTLLRNAADLIYNIVAEINTDDLEKDYDLESVSHNIYEFLDDINVYVEWGKKNESISG